jgi:Ca-activated chloride channel family protein
MRRFINNGQLPPAGAIRIEELINYFSMNIRSQKKMIHSA